MSAVKLYHQLIGEADEIDDVLPYWLLSSKLRLLQPSVCQLRP